VELVVAVVEVAAVVAVVWVAAGEDAAGEVGDDDPALEEDEPVWPEAVVAPCALDPLVDEGVVVGDVAVAGGVLDGGGLARSPLLFSWLSISDCTLATWAATAAGVPPAPSAGKAFSCFRSALSCASRVCDGWAFRVTTSWSAIVVVLQAGQL
jgi:hypothetical protein